MDMSRKVAWRSKIARRPDRCVPPELANSLGNETTAHSKVESETDARHLLYRPDDFDRPEA
jgi:hypothetical protein